MTSIPVRLPLRSEQALAKKGYPGERERTGVRNDIGKNNRDDQIIEQLIQHGRLTVAEIAAHVGVSEITVRRDLDRLAELGCLVRVHGGARYVAPQEPEPPILQRQAIEAEAKRTISLAAAALVKDGDVIGIQSGSTTNEFARALAMRAWRRLEVVTNSFNVAMELMRTPGVHLVFVGGSVSPGEMGAFGVFAEDMLKGIALDKLFITCRAVHPRSGLTNALQAEYTVGTDRAMVTATKEVIVLADHTKLGQVFMIETVPIVKVDVLVTDSLAAPDMLEEFRRGDMRVIVAPLQEAVESGAVAQERPDTV